MVSNIVIRPAALTDETFLWSMLFEAAYSREQGKTSPDELRDIPELAHYVENWGSVGDLGVVAEKDGVLLGAAWLRLFTGDNAGYGYVDGETPELAIGVTPETRGTGVGTALLDSLLFAAKEYYKAVSLSVREDNPARRLYARIGFIEVPASAHANPAGSTSVTMVLRY